MFFTGMTFSSCKTLKCASMNHQKCKVRPEIININNNEPSFYPYIILLNKWSGSCNNINDQYGKLWLADVVKDMYLGMRLVHVNVD